MTTDHAKAKAIYESYLAREAMLAPRRDYARRVAKATGGTGQTPVEPLATMGSKGGPLVCDVCRKPMILEGGAYQGLFADEGWRRNPTKDWTSWISGGMVVRIETNGMLFLFHGYPGRSGCVQIADKAERQRRADFVERPDLMEILDQLSAYFAAELPEQNSDAVLNDIYRVLFKYDPGLGVNAP